MANDDETEKADGNDQTSENLFSSAIDYMSHLGCSFQVGAAEYMSLASLPFLVGTYFGYRRSLSQQGGAKVTAGSAAEQKIVAQAPIIAARALALGTLASFAGVGFLSASILYATGSSTVEELVNKCRRWEAPKFLDNLKWDEEAGRIEQQKLEDDCRVVAGMNEDEEMDYISRQYFEDNTKK